MMVNQDEAIEEILQNSKRIAVVGFSSKKYKAGYYVSDYLQEHGYKIIPVNPNLERGLGEPAYASLSDIPDPVDLVLLFQRSSNVPPFVDEAIAIKAKSVWMQLGILHDEAAQKAKEAGLTVVQDACMLVEHRNSSHRH